MAGPAAEWPSSPEPDEVRRADELDPVERESHEAHDGFEAEGNDADHRDEAKLRTGDDREAGEGAALQRIGEDDRDGGTRNNRENEARAEIGDQS